MAVKNITYTQPQVGLTSTNPQTIEGTTTVDGQPTLLIADLTTRQLLEGIYIELKKLNLRQELAFEETVTDEDVLCE